MLTIIHGDDTNASRNALQNIKEQQQPLILEGEKVTLTDLAQVFDGGGLFETQKVIVIEQLLSKRKKSSELESILNFLKERTLINELYFWEGKELDKKTLSLFPHATIKGYKLPQTLFLFVDSLKPNNGKQLVQLFHKTLEHIDAEIVFFMLVRQVRLLLALFQEGNQPIDEVKRLAPWQKAKLQKQAKAFSEQTLLSLHVQLYEIDKKAKTGALPGDLSLAIDNLLLTI